MPAREAGQPGVESDPYQHAECRKKQTLHRHEWQRTWSWSLWGEKSNPRIPYGHDVPNGYDVPNGQNLYANPR